jgi:NTE family protein
MPTEQHVPAQPVRFLEGESPLQSLEDGAGLCLSGGGYRAMLFHLGGLWRLNEAKWLSQLSRISSVSGGSITAGVLGLRWNQLQFQEGVATNFEKLVVAPVRGLAEKTIDAGAVIAGILLPGSISDRIVQAYEKYLFGGATLQDLPGAGRPGHPRFVINATNIQTGALWRFSQPYMGDYRVGLAPFPQVRLSKAVAASSAFPPVLSPVHLQVEQAYQDTKGADLSKPPFTTEVVLSDGGVYDNLGLETVWKRYKTVLVSDAGAKLAPDPEPHADWARHSIRVLDVIDNQVRSLRKRQLIESYKDANEPHAGAYWGIRSHLADYKLDQVLPCPEQAVNELANTPTRLQRLEPAYQERLINWGYAVCDAAIRKHVDSSLPCGTFPFPRGIDSSPHSA